MRTDAVIDARQVICKNASLIGFGTLKARVGSFLTYEDSAGMHYARMLARIKYAPALAGDEAPIRNWLLCAVLSRYGSNIGEHWVNPDWVRTIELVPTRTAEFFFAPKLQYTANMYRRLIEHGTLQEHYIDQHAERVAEFKARDARISCMQSSYPKPKE